MVIPCYIKHTFRGQPLNIISLIWYFGPVYNDNLQEYEGTILHNASRNQPGNMITTGSDFVGRVSFVGDLEWRNCSLKISQLRKKDSGAYLARLYGLAKPKPEQKKWGVQAQVNVMGKPLLKCFFPPHPRHLSFSGDTKLSLSKGQQQRFEVVIWKIWKGSWKDLEA